MNMRLLSIAVVGLAGFLAFGDFIHASIVHTPESFVSDVGRGIGNAITGVVTGFTGLFWG